MRVAVHTDAYKPDDFTVALIPKTPKTMLSMSEPFDIIPVTSSERINPMDVETNLEGPAMLADRRRIVRFVAHA